MAQRERVIYASQAVYIDGKQQSRVQTLGANTTFTSEDIFELGQLDIIDVVDDVPKVAITLNLHDFGDITTLAALCKTNPGTRVLSGGATDWRTNGHLTTTGNSNRYRGVCLADFGSADLPTIWAPVQDAAGLGDHANNTVEYTLFLDKVATNKVTFTYNTSGAATCNFSADGYDKTWFLNTGKYVNQETFTVASETTRTLGGGQFTPSTHKVATTKAGNMAFLFFDAAGVPAVRFTVSGTGVSTNYAINKNDSATSGDGVAGKFVYNSTTNLIVYPTDLVATAGDTLTVRYAANKYAAGNIFFDEDASKALADGTGAMRQGQVEVLIIDGSNATAVWRIQTATVDATLTREELKEIGHIKAYAQPVKFPLPITVAMDSLLSDLSDFAMLAGETWSSIVDLDIYKLLSKSNLNLVIMTYEQNDMEAGGTGVNRKWKTAPSARKAGSGHTTINAGDQEVPLAMIVVKNLKPTAENYNLAVGANATQAFNFRANNDLYVVDCFDMSGAELATLKTNVATLARVTQ